MPPSGAVSMVDGGNELGRVSISSTRVYRYEQDAYQHVVKDMERRGQLRKLAGYSARDFGTTGDSVLGLMQSQTVVRRQPAMSVSIEADHPLFAQAEHDVITLISTCDEDQTVAVSINLCLNRASADQLIALGQSTYDNRTVNGPVAFVQLGDEAASPAYSISEVHRHIAEHLGLGQRPHATSHFRLTEIRQFANLITAKEAIDRAGSELYGILAADEGWRYVGEDVIRDRLGRCWSTRTFVGIISLGDSTLSLNFRPLEYSTAADLYFERHFGSSRAYFSSDYCIAGLEHGPFLARELTAYRSCVVSDMQRRLQERRSLRLKVSAFGVVSNQEQRNSLYRSLVEDLARMRDQAPFELAGLVNVIERDSGFPESLDVLRQEVQALENEEQTIYLQRVNRLLVLVAWIGVAVAAAGIAVAVATAGPW